MKYSIAVVGATGLVGGMMLKVLEESSLEVGSVTALATARSAGSQVTFRGENLLVHDIANFTFAGVDIALFAGGEIASCEYAPKAVKAGAVVIDNSSAYRMDPQVPLVIPEVNPHHLRSHQGIIANPNCSTIQMIVALAPLHKAFGLKRLSAATYQSVSGTGKEAVEELKTQLKQVAEGQNQAIEAKVYPRQIACNLVPHIAAFDEDGYSGEERKMINETHKILDLPDLPVTATCVRVPVFFAHSEVIECQFAQTVTVEEARQVLAAAPGIRVMDEPSQGIYPTPLDGEGQDLVLVGRIRRDLFDDKRLLFWVVGDNLRKGAATNAVQIAETLVNMGLLGK